MPPNTLSLDHLESAPNMQFTLITAEQVYRCWQWLTIINNNALINSSEMHRQQLKNLPTCWTFNSIVHLGARLQKTLDTISTNQIAPFLTPTVGIYQGSIPFQACRGTCHVIVGISWFASKFLLPAILQLTLLREHTRPVMWGGGKNCANKTTLLVVWWQWHTVLDSHSLVGFTHQED